MGRADRRPGGERRGDLLALPRRSPRRAAARRERRDAHQDEDPAPARTGSHRRRATRRQPLAVRARLRGHRARCGGQRVATFQYRLSERRAVAGGDAACGQRWDPGARRVVDSPRWRRVVRRLRRGRGRTTAAAERSDVVLRRRVRRARATLHGGGGRCRQRRKRWPQSAPARAGGCAARWTAHPARHLQPGRLPGEQPRQHGCDRSATEGRGARTHALFRSLRPRRRRGDRCRWWSAATTIWSPPSRSGPRSRSSPTRASWSRSCAARRSTSATRRCSCRSRPRP